MKTKIVVTGLGIYCPIGKNIEELKDSLINSTLGIRDISEFNIEGFRNSKGGVVNDIGDYETKTGLRSNLLLNPSVDQAIRDSDILNSNIDPSKISVSIGTSLGGFGGFVEWLFKNHSTNHGIEYSSSLNSKMKIDFNESVINIPAILLGTEIASNYGFSGPMVASITACSAGGNAIAFAIDSIRNGNSDVMVIVAVDPITELTFMGFNSLMAMTKTELKPLDKNRSGLLIGEGSGCIIIESEEHAIKRGAKIYSEVAGYGLSNDAYHSTQPHPNGDGAVVAINKALDDADITKEEIQYINVHGTGTKHNDITELKALQRIFGEELINIPISSSKSMIGHTLGAAGTIEAIICIVALYNDIIPPSLNFSEMIEGFEYNVATEAIQNCSLNTVMSNSFGFGGNGASLIFKKYNN